MGVVNEAAVLNGEIERVERYDALGALFERDSVFFTNLEKSTTALPVSDRAMRIVLEMSPGGYTGQYSPDGGDMGTGAGPAFDNATMNVVHLRHAVQWTKLAEWGTDDKRKAVINTFRHLLSTAMAQFRRDIDSVIMGPGTANGVLGRISAWSQNSPAGFDTITLNLAGDGYGARLVRQGLKVGVYDTTISTRRGNDTEITFCDYPNKQIRVVTGVLSGVVSGDLIVIEGLSGATPVSLNNVQYHDNNSSTGTWLNFNRANVPQVRSSRVNAASSALTLPLPRLALNKVGDRVGIDKMENKKMTAWMHPANKAAYEELGQIVSIINKTTSEEGLDLYFGDNMRMAGAPVKCSFSWDKTRIDFIDLENWGRAELRKIGFYEVPEGTGARRIFELRGASGGIATAMLFYLVVSFNIFVKNPAMCTYIDGLLFPSGY